jgi:hypothetical protein
MTEAIGDGLGVEDVIAYRVLCRYVGALAPEMKQRIDQLWIEIWDAPGDPALYAKVSLILPRTVDPGC